MKARWLQKKATNIQCAQRLSMYTLDPARARATGVARGIMGASKAPAGRECGTPDSAGDAEMDLTFSDAEFDLT